MYSTMGRCRSRGLLSCCRADSLRISGMWRRNECRNGSFRLPLGLPPVIVFAVSLFDDASGNKKSNGKNIFWI